jgi:protein SCO1/2
MRLVIVLLVAMMVPAVAGLPRAMLDTVGVRLPAGARLDPGITMRDTEGRLRSVQAMLGGKPAFLNFVDYTCNTLCGTDLMLLTDAIRRAGIDPATFHILVVGIDPKDSAAAATKMEYAEIPPALRTSTTFLLPDAATVLRTTTALGFRYAYDRDADQFAHPVIVYVLGPDGSVRTLLSPLLLTAGDLRQALAGPTAPPPSLTSRLHALCYAYDPATGIYSLRIANILRLGGVLTLMLMAAGIGLLAWRRRPV